MIKTFNYRLTAAALFLVLFFSCRKQDTIEQTDATVYTASGDILAKLNEFREQLGALNTTPGHTTGRREISWDGVPDSLLNKNLPFDFFNPIGPQASVSQQRGLRYDDGNFRVSTDGFSGVNVLAAGEFRSFSGNKAFANVSNDLWPIGFQVAGQQAAASVSGFGMVFSDVDLPNSTSLEFFNNDKSLGKYFVPAKQAGSSFSFLGVYFKSSAVTKVLVRHEGRLTDGDKDISQGG
ncbi:MAG TPA: hypothetical protein VEB42_11500, partial [Chitinophagaceae bacterium]|nr:hypothetical protein [Chitinophagaceae bacterium]